MYGSEYQVWLSIWDISLSGVLFDFSCWWAVWAIDGRESDWVCWRDISLTVLTVWVWSYFHTIYHLSFGHWETKENNWMLWSLKLVMASEGSPFNQLKLLLVKKKFGIDRRWHLFLGHSFSKFFFVVWIFSLHHHHFHYFSCW